MDLTGAVVGGVVGSGVVEVVSVVEVVGVVVVVTCVVVGVVALRWW